MVIRKFDWELIEDIYNRKDIIIGVLENHPQGFSYVDDEMLKNKKFNGEDSYSNYLTPVIIVDNEIFPGYIEEIKEDNLLSKITSIFKGQQ